ncbi:MAG: GrpB family protein [Cytophagales bacterium]
MKVKIVPYNPDWEKIYLNLQTEISHILLSLDPKIEHIGSTSIKGLWAKPVIDILVGIDEEKLDVVCDLLYSHHYIYIQAFTDGMPERRFFIRMKEGTVFPNIISDSSLIDERINDNKIAHVHIVGYNSNFWNRHIAFREYLKHFDEVRMAYQVLKQELSRKNWNNAFEFNEAKDAFIQFHQANAIEWYKTTKENEI